MVGLRRPLKKASAQADARRKNIKEGRFLIGAGAGGQAELGTNLRWGVLSPASVGQGRLDILYGQFGVGSNNLLGRQPGVGQMYDQRDGTFGPFDVGLAHAHVGVNDNSVARSFHLALTSPRIFWDGSSLTYIILTKGHFGNSLSPGLILGIRSPLI